MTDRIQRQLTDLTHAYPVEISNATLKGARVENIELAEGQENSSDGETYEYLVITFSSGATLYADDPTLYLGPRSSEQSTP